MSKLSNPNAVGRKLSKIKVPERQPLWRGPQDPGDLGGVTQSLLNEFLCCRERFRIKWVEGIRPADAFSRALEFGNMWHVCEEHHARGEDWLAPLLRYCKQLCLKYPISQEEIDKWYNVVQRMFPVYAQKWERHPDVKVRSPLLQEEVFHVPYELPSSKRTVWLRGKFDSVDLLDKHRDGPRSFSRGIWLQENKTKGDIDEQEVVRRLSFDIQTMLYLVALEQYRRKVGEPAESWKSPVLGVRYNVIRRPFSGGKGSIKQHQPSKSNPSGESKEQFYERFMREYVLVEPDYWFMRWKVEVTHEDVTKYQRQFLDPILEQLCDWYEWVTRRAQDPFDPAGAEDNYHGIHFRTPFGIWNSISETGGSDMDAYLLDPNAAGMVRADSLFSELVGG